MSGMTQILELPKRPHPPRGLASTLPRPEGGATIHILPCIRRESLPDVSRPARVAERG